MDSYGWYTISRKAAPGAGTASSALIRSGLTTREASGERQPGQNPGRLPLSRRKSNGPTNQSIINEMVDNAAKYPFIFSEIQRGKYPQNGKVVKQSCNVS